MKRGAISLLAIVMLHFALGVPAGLSDEAGADDIALPARFGCRCARTHLCAEIHGIARPPIHHRSSAGRRGRRGGQARRRSPHQMATRYWYQCVARFESRAVTPPRIFISTSAPRFSQPPACWGPRRLCSSSTTTLAVYEPEGSDLPAEGMFTVAYSSTGTGAYCISPMEMLELEGDGDAVALHAGGPEQRSPTSLGGRRSMLSDTAPSLTPHVSRGGHGR